MSNIALVSMMGNIGTKLDTQGGGYYAIVKKIIRDQYPNDYLEINPAPSTWNDFDIILVCESINFVEGSFNIPGGPQKIHFEKMQAMANYQGRIKFINSRFDFDGFNKRLKIPGAIFPNGPVEKLLLENTIDRKCVIGDSHALSVWQPGYSLDFTPGRTLYGFLKRNTPELINQQYAETTLYFGCIDVRFHLMRQADPKQATIDLFTRYTEFAKRLKDCTLATIIPVEHTSRKIPGTGLYKKKPFFGTREERQELVDIANKIIKDSGLKYISWPKDWIDEDGTKMLEILEQRQSVHLRPKFYTYINQILEQ